MIRNTSSCTPALRTQHNNTTHAHNFSTPTNMTRPASKMKMNIGNLKANRQQGGSRGSQQTPTGASPVLPPPVVETVISSNASQTSSIGIGEFGMNPSRKGTAAAFFMAIKSSLFPKLKFLQGTNASLDFSMDTTSICGYLRLCCGVSEADAYRWWDDHRGMVKNIHTDCRNNKIKMLKMQFNCKFR